MIRRKGISGVLCILLLTAIYVLQSSLGLRLAFFGTHIDLLPLIVAAVGVTLGSGAGLACGFAAGLLYDITGTGVEGLYPLYYLVCGIVCGFIGERFREHEWCGTALGAAAMVLLLAALRYLFSFQFDGVSVLLLVKKTTLQLLYMLIFSPLILRLVRMAGGQTGNFALKKPPEGGNHGAA